MKDAWPALPLDAWESTYATLHRWLQIVGKVRLARTPWINHGWHVPLYVNARGFTTGLIPHDARGFEVQFDFCDHRLLVDATDGRRREFPLEPMTVADFYARFREALAALGVETDIWPVPVEIPGDVARFDEDDAHAAYDAEYAARAWRAFGHAHRVFTRFRAEFVGKSSPVHLFWGAFDLAVTRFSGRPAPPHPGGAPHVPDWVMREAYAQEVISVGFWPGAGLGEAAFYAYAYPEPAGFAAADVAPDAAYYHGEMGEFVLPYHAVRTAPDPDAYLLEFLRTAYAAAADRAGWDRKTLDRLAPPGPGA